MAFPLRQESVVLSAFILLSFVVPAQQVMADAPARDRPAPETRQGRPSDAPTRQALIDRIMQAQGLLETFEKQLAQQRASTLRMTSDSIKALVPTSTQTDSRKVSELLDRFVERTSNVLTGKDLLEAWSREYARTLTDADLESILAYYESPAGRKDAAAQQAATPAFSAWMMSEYQRRFEKEYAEFARQMQEIPR